MQRLTLRTSAEEVDGLSAELWTLGTVGIRELEDRLEAFFDDETDTTALALIFSENFVEISRVDATIMAVPVESEPVPLGRRFLVSDRANIAAEDRHVLHLKNGEAFGSGRHETTQLAAEALEDLDLKGKAVADVGCGSGILSEIAQELGAGVVFACDIHEGSILSARSQFPRSRYFVGSADSIRTACADVMIANITPSIIDLLSPDLSRILKCDGVLLLSGFLADHVPCAFAPQRVREKNGWLLWECRPQGCGKPSPTVVQPFDQRWW